MKAKTRWRFLPEELVNEMQFVWPSTRTLTAVNERPRGSEARHRFTEGHYEREEQQNKRMSESPAQTRTGSSCCRNGKHDAEPEDLATGLVIGKKRHCRPDKCC